MRWSIIILVTLNTILISLSNGSVDLQDREELIDDEDPLPVDRRNAFSGSLINHLSNVMTNTFQFIHSTRSPVYAQPTATSKTQGAIKKLQDVIDFLNETETQNEN